MKDELPLYTIETLRSSESEAKDFDFFRFEYFAKDIDHLKASHRHYFYTFVLVTGGGGSHAIDFHKYDLVPGRLFLIAPGQVHAWIEFKKVKGFVILFTDSFMALSKGRKMMSAWPLFRPNQEAYYDLDVNELQRWNTDCLNMEEEISLKDEFTSDGIFYHISSLLVRTTRLSLGKHTKRQAIGQDFLFSFQELIEENFLQWKTPVKYADKMNVTGNYLNTLCKKKSGKSAGELIRQRILLEAKRLLAHTQLTVGEIAFKLDFKDNSYFGRYFKKYAGTTPEKFRMSQIN